MRSFLERLLFQYISYNEDRTPVFGRRIQTAFIYTMNVPEDAISEIGYDKKFKAYTALLERILGPSKAFISSETLQVNDYSNYNMTMFDENERKLRRKTVFPLDCQNAFALGAEMVNAVGY